MVLLVSKSLKIYMTWPQIRICKTWKFNEKEKNIHLLSVEAVKFFGWTLVKLNDPDCLLLKFSFNNIFIDPKFEFTHFITISPQYKKRKRDHINMKGSSVNAVWKTENYILNLKTLGLLLTNSTIELQNYLAISEYNRLVVFLVCYSLVSNYRVISFVTRVVFLVSK
jgi:hypothetical protein